MKKLLSMLLVAAVLLPAAAQNAETASAPKRTSLAWPAYFAVGEFPAVPDLAGIRLTVPFSTRQENVTGIDLGLWGRALYFQGLQLNLLRNDVKDEFAGIQIGLYNSVSGAQFVGTQIGLWNEAQLLCGMQVGLVNLAGQAEGFQIGLINRSETMHGYQFGLINVIRDAELRFFPVVNIGF